MSTEIDEETFIEEKEEIVYRLIVFDDDFNTFNHVIISFMDVLGYGEIRSEQLAWNIHNTGKAVVKEGKLEHLLINCQGLRDRKLDARIL
jgi:ATP-dependent Clp protease adaptor protein ClpS